MWVASAKNSQRSISTPAMPESAASRASTLAQSAGRQQREHAEQRRADEAQQPGVPPELGGVPARHPEAHLAEQVVGLGMRRLEHPDPAEAA